ncbi:MAG: alkaline phosphatase [Planctomycetota bacterium]
MARVRTGRSGRARNVIFLVSDGMSFGTLQMADRAMRLWANQGSRWVELLARPGVRRALQMTHSANSLVTDSAAAGTAWGAGVHVRNGAVNFTPEGREPRPILVEAKANGKATGLVTSTRVTHATPAAFVANVPKRDMEDAIAEQTLERGVDLVLGGGAKHFPASLLERHDRYRVLRTRNDLLAYERGGSRGPRPALGVFNNSHLRYEIDRRRMPSEAREPSLAELTRVAIAELDRAPDGFVMQIEGGRVDHAAHANDAAGLVLDQWAFDEALAVADDFARGRDDTLVIVTTDHGNANPGHTLYLDAGDRAFASMANATQSFEWIFEQLERRRDADRVGAISELLEQAASVTLTPLERETLARAFGQGEMTDAFRPASQPGPVLGSILANHFGVAFISPNHTADYVELTAYGPGSEPIIGLMDNIELHPVVRRALGLV